MNLLKLSKWFVQYEREYGPLENTKENFSIYCVGSILPGGSEKYSSECVDT